ncbi:MAG: UDP-N-acetylmuramate dehydrogenase [Proteobacteria bacterium]|nr:UDP-N-acetylmuramate dehydrogenase [Pseudomonadota bacterium]
MASLNSHADDLAGFWQGEILWDSPMSRFSSLKVGGPAEAILFAKSLAELKKLIGWLHENDICWRVIGRGSNILVSDNGLPGVVIFLAGEFAGFETLDSSALSGDRDAVKIRAGGGCLLPKLVHHCITSGLAGLEFAVGIPGSVGGAVVMNAGGWDHEIGELIDSAVVMDNNGVISTVRQEDLGLTYRQWGMAPETILLSATFLLAKGDPQIIEAESRRYQQSRKQKQPLGLASAGSFFKNPPGQPAGRLIEEVGLKGYRIGDAMISEQHANFIVNTGKASASDIISLMQEAQAKVFERFGIKLEPEVHILGIKENRA